MQKSWHWFFTIFVKKCVYHYIFAILSFSLLDLFCTRCCRILDVLLIKKSTIVHSSVLEYEIMFLKKKTIYSELHNILQDIVCLQFCEPRARIIIQTPSNWFYVNSFRPLFNKNVLRQHLKFVQVSGYKKYRNFKFLIFTKNFLTHNTHDCIILT